MMDLDVRVGLCVETFLGECVKNLVAVAFDAFALAVQEKAFFAESTPDFVARQAMFFSVKTRVASRIRVRGHKPVGRLGLVGILFLTFAKVITLLAVNALSQEILEALFRRFDDAS
jgi:hypothetical protein